MVIIYFFLKVIFYIISNYIKDNLIRKSILISYIFKNKLSYDCVIINSHYIFYQFNFT